MIFVLIINVIVFLFLSSPFIALFIYFKYKRFNKRLLGKAILIITFLANLSGVIYFYNNSAENQNIQKIADDEKFKKLQLEHLKENQQIAKSLLNFLRNSGVTEDLIIDVKATELRRIRVVVTNAWLHYPKFEQKQMRQSIELALKKIVQPNGYPFEVVDMLGNSI